jgi:hypothetical protein
VRRLLALIPVALVAVSCGGGSASPASTSRPVTTAAAAAPKALHVELTAESHHPKLGHTWTYQVHVTDAATGKPVAARIHLQFWFNGVSVGEVGTHKVADGVWKETIAAKGAGAFPPAAVGQPLVLHAIVSAKGYRAGKASWKVSVVK